MSAPLDALAANRYFARKRRVELLRSGGLTPAIADLVFWGPSAVHTPSPALVIANVTNPAVIVSRHVGVGDMTGVLWDNSSTITKLEAISDGTLTFTAVGFGAVASIAPAIPLTNGRHIFVTSFDIPNTRIVLEHNGTVIFDDTNAGFTHWATASSTYAFGTSADDATHETLEIYFRRLSPAL